MKKSVASARAIKAAEKTANSMEAVLGGIQALDLRMKQIEAALLAAGIVLPEDLGIEVSKQPAKAGKK